MSNTSAPRRLTRAPDPCFHVRFPPGAAGPGLKGNAMYGIDFGTSNTVVTIRDGSGSRLLNLGSGEVVPSLMYFERDRRPSIGDEAIADYTEARGRFGGKANLYNSYRFFQALKLALKDTSFKGTNIFGSFWPAESLAGLYLREVKRRADEAAGTECVSAVVGRPVVLSGKAGLVGAGRSAGDVEDAVVERYRKACAYAGFEELRFVPEPVAAAAGMAGELSGTALVFDFGGGTLDVAVARIGGGGTEILSSAGRDLGGYLLNEDVSRARIIRHFGSEGKIRTMKGTYLDMPRWITDQVASFYALPLSDLAATRRVIKELIYDARPIDKPSLRGLAEFLDRNLTFDLFGAIDDAKIALSTVQASEIAYALPPHLSFRERLSRAEFEAIAAPRVVEAKAVVMEALRSAGKEPGDVAAVVRVGGSSRIPAFAAMLEESFPGRVREGQVFTSIAAGLLAAHDAGLSAA